MLGLAVVFAVVLTADTLPATPVAPSPTVDSMAPTQPATGTSPALLATLTPPPSATAPGETAAPTEASSPTPDKLSASREASSTTETAVASPSPRATATPRPTQTPSSTPSRTPTRTPSPPPTSTWTPSVTPTETPPPTDTRVYTPTVTSPPAQSPTPRPSATLQPTVPGTCAPPPGWQPYVIRSGDNLFRLALRAGLSTAELQQVNCISNAASITTGQVIYMPPTFFAGDATSSTPAAGSTPVGSSGGTGTTLFPLRLGCLLTQIRFSSPDPGSTLSGLVTLRGTATLSNLPDFEYYKVELRGVDGVYRNLAQSASPAPGPDSVLALLNTAEFAGGEYQLVLTVVDRTGNFPEPCAIRVYIQN